MFDQRTLLRLTVALTISIAAFQAASADPVAYWNFDTDFNASGGGPTYDATPANGASISSVQSKWGGAAAHFDSASLQYAVTSASPVPAGTYSYSCWYYLDVDVTGIDYAQYATLATGENFTLFFNIDQDAGADPGNDDDFLVSRVQTDGPAPGQTFEFRPLPRPTVHKQWVNYIATVQYDPGMDTTTLEGFYNGESLGFNAYGGSVQIATGKPLDSTYLAFGVDRFLESRFWEGYIDDVAIYDYVLSADEIAALQTGPASDISAGTPGDYNGDGTVNAADYTVWRDSLGQTSSLSNRDPSNSDPLVNGTDYDYWKANFGAGSGGGSAALNGAVPEPGMVGLVLLAAGFGVIPLRIRVKSD